MKAIYTSTPLFLEITFLEMQKIILLTKLVLVLTGPTQCIDLPAYADFGYDSIEWDGTKVNFIIFKID